MVLTLAVTLALLQAQAGLDDLYATWREGADRPVRLSCIEPSASKPDAARAAPAIPELGDHAAPPSDLGARLSFVALCPPRTNDATPATPAPAPTAAAHAAAPISEPIGERLCVRVGERAIADQIISLNDAATLQSRTGPGLGTATLAPAAALVLAASPK